MPDETDATSGRRRQPLRALRRIVEGMLSTDPAEIERAAVELGRSRKVLAPLALVAGTLALMIVGVKPLIKNWRLTLVELVPAAWIWFSMWNLKSHILDQRGVHAVHTWYYLPATVLLIALGIAAFYCNALFIFAIGESPPLLRPAVPKVNQHLRTIVGWGVAIGSMHAFSTLVISQHSKFLYDLTMCIVVGLMMVTFVTVPAGMAGIIRRKELPRKRAERVAVGGTLAAVASLPGFILDRIGLLLIGTQSFRTLGFAILSLGVALQVAATSSTKAVKISAKMIDQDAGEPAQGQPSVEPAG